MDSISYELFENMSFELSGSKAFSESFKSLRFYLDDRMARERTKLPLYKNHLCISLVSCYYNGESVDVSAFDLVEAFRENNEQEIIKKIKNAH